MSSLKKVRAYSVIQDRIHAVLAGDRSWNLIQIALLSYPPHRYPLIALCRSSTEEAPQLSISAGIHGDEPAGVEAVLRFLESDAHRLHPSLNLILIPCQNPFGYEHDCRVNGCGLDLNRQFDKPETQAIESEPLRRFLLNRQIDCVVECHEDIDAEGFYVWELKKEGRSEIAREIVNNIAGSYPITRARKIEGCRVTRGIVHPTYERIVRTGGWSHTYFLFQNGASHCLTPETPASWPFEKRVAMHLTAIRTAIENAKRDA